MTREDSLMAAFAAGDRLAFNELAERILPTLHAWFHSTTRDWHLAEDLTSDTIFNIATHASTYCGSGQFWAWAYRVAKNVLTDFWRKKRLKTTSDSQCSDQPEMEWLVSRDCGPDEIAEQREESQIAMSHLQSIFPEQADTLWRYCCGESLPDIADRCGSPLPTVKRRAQIARQKLQRMMAGDAA
jgi:RNA polymerase sigma factor (sigma-70 family)